MYVKTEVATKRVTCIPSPFFYALSEFSCMYAENQAHPRRKQVGFEKKTPRLATEVPHLCTFRVRRIYAGRVIVFGLLWIGLC